MANQTILTMGAPPQTVTVDLGAKYTNLEILGYLPRQDYAGNAHVMTGNITSYMISVSSDNVNFTKVDSGTWAGDSTLKIAEWSPPSTGRYVQLKAVSTVGNVSTVINELEFGGRLDTPSTTLTNVVTTGLPWRVSPKNAPGTIVNVNGFNPACNSSAASIFVYDMACRFIKRIGVNGYIRKDFGMARGVYIFKSSE